ncbi:hypothetical protein NX02_09685 [Sphingomonas sanxanigenens DSM 19645 = NX02]|uniref:Uncharacterized protein n=1 Tax=Sphingomonas sanxanigenens DSM 19645 = NX02 TaxID=1123269 RepID=W0AAZ8_9SPHN|nr:hypothetical protein NX02_09685 [Sphingomonas sanxanigenens DSM 19645 = NX02]
MEMCDCPPHLVGSKCSPFRIWGIIRNDRKGLFVGRNKAPSISPLVFGQVERHSIQVGARLTNFGNLRIRPQLEIDVMKDVSGLLGRASVCGQTCSQQFVIVEECRMQ